MSTLREERIKNLPEEPGDFVPLSGNPTASMRTALETLSVRLEVATKEIKHRTSNELRQMADLAGSAVALVKHSIGFSGASSEKRTLLANHRKLARLADEADSILRDGLLGLFREEVGESKDISAAHPKKLYSLYIELMEIIDQCGEVADHFEAFPKAATCYSVARNTRSRHRS